MTEKNYKFDVKMTCGGCSGAVQRALQKTEGISSFDVDLPTQRVTVTGTITYGDLLEAIKKTGKEVLFGEEVPAEPLESAGEVVVALVAD